MYVWSCNNALGTYTCIEYSTESLSSSIFEYRYENGRRYHAYKDGLDIIHHIYLLMLNDDLHMAPLENPQRILDLGTGTGIWAIDIAERYPSAEVIGTDLSPIQPRWVPTNVQFQIDDGESDWTWENSFDFIHMRHLSGAIKDWQKLVHQAFRFLKPGGYVEIAEYDMGLFSDDGTFSEDLWLWKFYDLVNKAANKNGCAFQIVSNVESLLNNAGFEQPDCRMYKLPLGLWAADPKMKEIGAYVLLNGESAYDAFGMALFTRELGMTVDEAREIVTGAEKDCRNKRIHSYSKQHLWWARKPETEC
ncbi:S-adenosyl-L-methionine-dependent methyltransferase [Morchella snyderi]|nr:S-adenosyl-L-methionine-dependent methyltransferase [Morchella snyderi]